MTRLLVATTNSGKLAELLPLLAPLGYEACGWEAIRGLVAASEDADTFAGNARIKALQAAASTGLSVLADDSGLQVNALDGAPGVQSARYAGESASDSDNLQKLLSALHGVTDRRAQFTCAICMVEGGVPVIEVEGTCAGTLLTEPRGTDGFGYDPLFVPQDAGTGVRTFAEMTREEKGRVSHRGRALKALRAALRQRATDGSEHS